MSSHCSSSIQCTQAPGRRWVLEQNSVFTWPQPRHLLSSCLSVSWTHPGRALWATEGCEAAWAEGSAAPRVSSPFVCTSTRITSDVTQAIFISSFTKRCLRGPDSEFCFNYRCHFNTKRFLSAITGTDGSAETARVAEHKSLASSACLGTFICRD